MHRYVVDACNHRSGTLARFIPSQYGNSTVVPCLIWRCTHQQESPEACPECQPPTSRSVAPSRWPRLGTSSRKVHGSRCCRCRVECAEIRVECMQLAGEEHSIDSLLTVFSDRNASTDQYEEVIVYVL